MDYPKDTEQEKSKDASKDQHLVLDGTVNLDYSEDEQVPRIKGLIELLGEYFGDKSGRDR